MPIISCCLEPVNDEQSQRGRMGFIKNKVSRTYAPARPIAPRQSLKRSDFRRFTCSVQLAPTTPVQVCHRQLPPAVGAEGWLAILQRLCPLDTRPLLRISSCITGCLSSFLAGTIPSSSHLGSSRASTCNYLLLPGPDIVGGFRRLPSSLPRAGLSLLHSAQCNLFTQQVTVQYRDALAHRWAPSL